MTTSPVKPDRHSEVLRTLRIAQHGFDPREVPRPRPRVIEFRVIVPTIRLFVTFYGHN